MEHNIIIFKGINYKAEETPVIFNACKGCAFFIYDGKSPSHCDNNAAPCCASERDDNTDVIYKQVETKTK